MKDPYPLFDQMLDIYVSQSQRMFENQGLITDLKHIPTLINDWENNIAQLLGRIQAKRGLYWKV